MKIFNYHSNTIYVVYFICLHLISYIQFESIPDFYDVCIYEVYSYAYIRIRNLSIQYFFTFQSILQTLDVEY